MDEWLRSGSYKWPKTATKGKGWRALWGAESCPTLDSQWSHTVVSEAVLKNLKMVVTKLGMRTQTDFQLISNFAKRQVTAKEACRNAPIFLFRSRYWYQYLGFSIGKYWSSSDPMSVIIFGFFFLIIYGEWWYGKFIISWVSRISPFLNIWSRWKNRGLTWALMGLLAFRAGLKWTLRELQYSTHSFQHQRSSPNLKSKSNLCEHVAETPFLLFSQVLVDKEKIPF